MSHAIDTVRESQVPAVTGEEAQKILALVVHGDLSRLSPEQKVTYYQMRCDALGVDWRTKPFAYVTRDGRESLYLLAEGAHQLRVNRGIHPLGKPTIEYQGDNVVVTVTMVDRDGRQETDVGVVFLTGLRGQAQGDAIMKAVTKARRRCTLALCGLGSDMVLDGDVIDTSWEPAPDEIDEQRAAMRDYNRSITGPRMPSHGLFKRFWATAREHGWHTDEIHGCILELYGHESVNQLTHTQTMEMINRIVSGLKWVDPRQQSMDELDAAIEATAREVPSDDDPPVDSETGEILDDSPDGDTTRDADWIACKQKLDAASSAKEVNAAWRDTMEAGFGSDPELRQLYDARLADFYNG